jgi:hypothetical protein
MGVACSTNGREEKHIQRFSYKPELKSLIEGLTGAGEDIVVPKEVGCCVDRIRVPQDSGRLL